MDILLNDRNSQTEYHILIEDKEHKEAGFIKPKESRIKQKNIERIFHLLMVSRYLKTQLFSAPESWSSGSW